MGCICIQILRLISIGILMLFCAIAHANLIVKDGTLTLETGDVLSVQNISIVSSGTLKGDLSSAASIRVSGNWSNSGTFNHNNDSVYFTGIDTSAVSGTNTFHTLIADHAESDTGSGKAIIFAANSTQTITHTLTLKGSEDNLMALTSSSQGSAAELDVTGATVSAEFLDISDSYLSGYPEYVNPQHSSSSYGNTLGWFPPTLIQVHKGDNQSATVGNTVATRPSVIIKDTNNNPVPNIRVTFAVSSGGGHVLDESLAVASETTVTSNTLPGKDRQH